jgi:hypothetical protein
MAKMIVGETEKETVKLTAEALGVDEEIARYIIAIETGESVGDVIEDGKEST